MAGIVLKRPLGRFELRFHFVQLLIQSYLRQSAALFTLIDALLNEGLGESVQEVGRERPIVRIEVDLNHVALPERLQGEILCDARESLLINSRRTFHVRAEAVDECSKGMAGCGNRSIQTRQGLLDHGFAPE